MERRIRTLFVIMYCFSSGLLCFYLPFSKAGSFIFLFHVKFKSSKKTFCRSLHAVTRPQSRALAEERVVLGYHLTWSLLLAMPLTLGLTLHAEHWQIFLIYLKGMISIKTCPPQMVEHFF